MSQAAKGGLPPKEGKFYLDVVGDTTKQPFRGDFECKIRNNKEKAFSAKHEAFLNGDFADQLDMVTLITHRMLAYLKYSLIEFPKFWRDSDLGYELYDLNVVKEVYDKVVAFEDDWFREVWGEDAVDALRGNSEDSEKTPENDGKEGE